MNIQRYFIHVNQFYSKLIRVCFRILVQPLILTEAVTVVLRKLVSKYTNIDERIRLYFNHFCSSL